MTEDSPAREDRRRTASASAATAEDAASAPADAAPELLPAVSGE
ncbi:hypothetical protein [Halorientalis regularis]|nr:hypothetical protein [Halorientalis regularis]